MKSFLKKLNPCWWTRNEDEPRAPDWHNPPRPWLFRWMSQATWCNWHWRWIRNPFHNFTHHVIGWYDKNVNITRHPFEKTPSYYLYTVNASYSGRSCGPTRRYIYRKGNWSFMWQWPYLNYNDGKRQAYIGWRSSGAFGIAMKHFRWWWYAGIISGIIAAISAAVWRWVF